MRGGGPRAVHTSMWPSRSNRDSFADLRIASSVISTCILVMCDYRLYIATLVVLVEQSVGYVCVCVSVR